MAILLLVVELSSLELVNFTELLLSRELSYSIACTELKVTHNVTCSIQFCMCNLHYHTVIGC